MAQSRDQVDFAISYAGEDSAIAREICQRLRELELDVFFADEARALLAGVDGESFFERLFTEAKQVIALISEDYRRKEWPRYEWDIIRKRDPERRYIPIRLDDTPILGLPDNVIHVPFTGDNWDEVVEACVHRLLVYEKHAGIHRPSEFEQILGAITNGSKGALAQAYQLVRDKRRRDPLADCPLPEGQAGPQYEVVGEEWLDFSRAKRRSVRVLVPPGLSREELRYNLKHCAATQFNEFKPDAVNVFAYWKHPDGYDIDGAYTAGRAVFAPFGEWGRALDGLAYNISTEEFDYSLVIVGEVREDASRPTCGSGPVIRCDRFQLTASLEGDELRAQLDTDLPGSARLMVSVSRCYLQTGDARTKYPMEYYSKKSVVGEWDTPRMIPLDDSNFLRMLKDRVDQLATMGEPIEVAAIEDIIQVALVVPINQNDPAFGERNVNLRGTMVAHDNGLRTVRCEEALHRPLGVLIPLPYRSRKASSATLEVGKCYRLSAETPLMPEVSPDDPLSALAEMRMLPPSSCVQVKHRASKDVVPWYHVDACAPDGACLGEGWINSTALIGQDIEASEG